MIVFLDYDGLLHPDAAYLVNGRPELRAAGTLFMWAPILEHALAPYPDAQIVLSTSCIVDDFRSGGIYWYDSNDMHAIERDTSNVLLADAGGSRQRMEHLMRAASAVVRAGALGVYVENAGLAHSAPNWLALADEGLEGMFRAFVPAIRRRS